MYVPPLDSILLAMGTDRAHYDRSPSVAVPKEMFKYLIQIALASSEFNEASYLKENSDVADGIAKGRVAGAKEHYIGYGYFEGRVGATPPVNERWYLATYLDVAQAVKLGKVKSANDHYNQIGAAEGRSPSPEYTEIAERWKKALVKS